jgi:hypothetical protein
MALSAQRGPVARPGELLDGSLLAALALGGGVAGPTLLPIDGAGVLEGPAPFRIAALSIEPGPLGAAPGAGPPASVLAAMFGSAPPASAAPESPLEQPASARLEAARAAPVASNARRQVMEIIFALPRGSTDDRAAIPKT